MTNPATSLHDVLASVRKHGEAPTPVAWAEVLGAEYKAPEFVRRHLEVVGLLRSAMAFLDTLPSATQARFERYVPWWWSSLFLPHIIWDGAQAGMTIEEPNLDALGTLGDLYEARLQGTVVVPTGEDQLSDLREQCLEWVEIIPRTPGLSAPVAQVLVSQVRHLIWLIDNAGTFGTSRVFQESQAVVAAVATAGADVTDPGARLDWRQRVQRTAATILIAVGLMSGAVTPALSASADAVEQLTHTVQAGRQLIDTLQGDVDDQ